MLHMVFKEMGKLNPGELEQREEIRSRIIPPSGGPDPKVWTMQFYNNTSIKYRIGTFDAWNSWYEFQMEVPQRNALWYPNIRKGDVVVDAGASWGSYALTAAILGAEVHAFEPDPRIFADLINNIKENNLTNITANLMGLSDNNCVVDWDEQKNMQLIRLDDYGIKDLDLIKIDVEGQELAVLEGARRLISQCKPKIILEAHLSYDGAMLNKAAELIMKMADGYQLIIYDSVESRDTIYSYFYMK